MSSDLLGLRVDLRFDQWSDPLEIEAATLQLRRELLQLDVDDIEPLAEQPPPNARGFDAAIVGTLAVTMGREAVVAVVRHLVQWVSRRSGRTVKLTIGDDIIELSDASAEDQRRLIESFLARQAGSPP